MEQFFEFCGVRFCLDAEREMPIDDCGRQFAVRPGPAEVRIQTECRAALPAPSGAFLGRRGEKLVWRDGASVTRLSQDPFRPQPHLSLRYTLPDVRALHCCVRAEDWPWAASGRFFWPGIALPQVLVHWSALVFHAAYVGWRGGAMLFVAPSGTGKSTQAALWERCRGAESINGDKAAIRLDGIPMAYGMPFCGTSGICRSKTLPLRCVVLLAQGPENRVRRLGVAEAVQQLSGNLFADMLIREEWQLARLLLLDLAAAVPVYRLCCTPDERAVGALEAALAQDVPP